MDLDGYELAELAAGDLQATFLPGVGMVGASLRHAGEELLDRRAGVAAYAARGDVMGIPLLHPWANRLAGHGYAVAGRAVHLNGASPLVHCEEHGLPIHGLVAGSSHWRVQAREPARLRAVLDFGAHPELLAAFPFPHELAIEATLTPAALTVATTLRATGDVPVPVAFGFHPYLRLPSADRRAWQLALPARRQLDTDGRGIPTGAAQRRPAARFALADRGFDDGYDGLAPGAAFSAAAGGRTVTVRLIDGFPAAQLFSPPGAPFVCFEPMTAPTNALRSGAGLRQVSPGGRADAVFAIEVSA